MNYSSKIETAENKKKIILISIGFEVEQTICTGAKS